MVRTFEPRYNPPDRKTLSTHYIPELYEKEKERVIEQIRGIQHFAITTDMWTSRANHSYCSLTVHYINDSFKLQSHLLEAKEFSDRHTGNNIAEELPVILDRWGLKPEMLSAATTDNGSNIVSAMEILKWTHMRCFSHTLQLAVHATLNLHKVSKAVSRCRRLVNHFHHSYKSSYLLRQKQEDLKHDQYSLIHDVITRWNSTYYMIDCILKQQQPLCAALLELRKSDLMPSEEEFSVMETFVEIMKPVVEITEAIGAQKWVTISTVRPLLFKLLNKQFEIVECDSSLAKSFKTTMYSNLSPRYCGLPLLLLNKATFLDPRLKGLSFLSIEDKKATLESIKDEAAQITIPQSVSLNSLEEPPAKRPREDHKLLKLLDSVMECGNSMSETSNPVDRANSEVSYPIY